MKTYRCYNTKLVQVEGWPTSDRRGAIDIYDEDNKFCFSISFGKKPKIQVYKLNKKWKNGDGDIEKSVGELKIKE